MKKRLLIVAALQICVAVITCTAQQRPIVRSYPEELYAGENVVDFFCMSGIRSIEPVLDSASTSMIEITLGDIGEFMSCPDSVRVRIRVNTVSEALNVRFKVINRFGVSSTVALTNRTWRLDEVAFEDVMVGDTVCRLFQIGIAGAVGSGIEVESEYLDSISVTIHGAFVRFTNPPPRWLRSGSTFRYEVCFAPTEPGIYKFPVITWIHRREPAGGYTNYPVADTAVVRALKFKQY